MCFVVFTGANFYVDVAALLCVSLSSGSETWPMKVEHELKKNRTEMSMIRWMCAV